MAKKKVSELDLVLELEKISEQVEKLYEKKEQLTAILIASKGHGYEKTVDVGGDSPFLRYRLTDNAKVFEGGQSAIWRPAAVRRYEIKIDRLKKMPKEKEEKSDS